MTNNRTYKVIISGGGTGGHIFPALAIADALKSSGRAINILFAGAQGRMEMEKVPAAGYEIIGLPVAGFQRSFTWGNLLLPIRLIVSLFKAISLVLRFKPDIAVGTGGYASGPVLFIANLFCRPTLIQEQNSYAGITNKILGRRSTRICVAYPGMDKFFPKQKIHYTGNPIRSNITTTQTSKNEARQFFGLQPDKKTILVIGGSLGARTINNTLIAGYSKILEAGYQLLWQTGKIYYQNIIDEVNDKQSDSMIIQEFIREMDKAYTAADLIISRAGANTISELCIVGKPTILVPSPNVAEDHQTSNAQALVSVGATVMVKDADANVELIRTALDIMNNEQKCMDLSNNIHELARPNATQDIVQDIWDIIDNKKL